VWQVISKNESLVTYLVRGGHRHYHQLALKPYVAG